MDLSIHFDQMLAMFIFFLASLFVLNVFVFKPTLKILNERENRLQGMEKEARRLEAECQEKLALYTSAMDKAKQEARHIRDDILKVANEEQKAVITQARDRAEKMIGEAKDVLVNETNQARSELKQSAEKLSSEMAEKILKRKVA